MIEYDAGSFKDPAGRVFHHDGAVFRTLSPQALDTYRAAHACGLVQALERDGLLLPTELLPADSAGLAGADVGAWVLRQSAVPFVSYSYEWSFEMLRDAALVTLRILDRALAAGFVLKDANAFNILFDHSRPALVDVPSIERYTEGAIWAGYGQFCRSFLFPLLAAAYRGVDFRVLLRGTLGEVPVQEMARLLRPRDYLRGGVLADVLAQARLERSFGRSTGQVKVAAAPVRYPKAALVANVRRLTRLVEGLKAPAAPTEWGGYETSHSYSETERDAKRTFVAHAVGERRLARVIDLGCNTGEYSHAALQTGCDVVALDVDPLAIDRLYVRSRDARVSPVVANLLNPTPAMGWALLERQALLARLRGDGFLALALVHHLRITGGVPLDRVVAQLFEVAPEGVVEWVDKEDGMVQRMLALRPDVYDDYTWKCFEALLRRHGRIVAVQESHGGRRKLCHVRCATVP
jgi:SAM-dependent methyltransferase